MNKAIFSIVIKLPITTIIAQQKKFVNSFFVKPDSSKANDCVILQCIRETGPRLSILHDISNSI